MYEVTYKITRPSTNVSFYTLITPEVSQQVKDYFFTNYKDVGKFISSEITFSNDNLECNIVLLWNSESEFNEFKNDPYLQTELFSIRNTYWQVNNITTVLLNQRTI